MRPSVFILVALLSFLVSWGAYEIIEPRSRPKRPDVVRATVPEAPTATVPPRVDPPGREAVEPWMIMRCQPLGELLKDIASVGRLSNDAAIIKALDTRLKEYASPRAIGFLDLARPMAVYLWGGLDKDKLHLMVALPVKDKKSLPELAAEWKLNFSELDDGVCLYRFKGSPPQAEIDRLYCRFVHGYAYMAVHHDDVLDEGELLTPERLFPAKPLRGLSSSFRLKHLPKELKTKIVDGLNELRGATANQGKTAAERKVLASFERTLLSWVRAIVEDGEELTSQLTLDRATSELAVEWALVPQQGSRLAEQFAALGKVSSPLAGLMSPEAGMQMLVNLSLPEDFRSAFGELFLEGASEPREPGKEENPGVRQIGAALIPSLRAGGVFDVAFSMRAPNKQGKQLLMLGIRVVDGDPVDQVVRDFVKAMPKEKRGESRLDAERVGETPIHRIDDTRPTAAQDRKTMGMSGYYVAVGKERILFASGQDALPALRTALRVPAGDAPLLLFEVSATRMLALSDDDAKAVAAAQREVYGDGKEPRDKIRVVLTGGPSLKLRASLHLELLRFKHAVERRTGK